MRWLFSLFNLLGIANRPETKTTDVAASPSSVPQEKVLVETIATTYDVGYFDIENGSILTGRV